MTHTKPLRLLTLLLALTVLLSAAGCLLTKADTVGIAPEPCAINESFEPSVSRNLTYTDPDTNYRALILDDLGLLSDNERQELLEDMQPLTRFGNVAFWSTNQYHTNEIEQARLKRKELFEFQSGSVFVINMKIRKLTIQSYGKMYEIITDSKARSITNNVSKLATSEQYYACCKKAFDQMNTLLEGGQISEPMKLVSFAVFALMLGLMLVLFVVMLGKKVNPLQEKTDFTKAIQSSGPLLSGALTAVYHSSTTVHREPSSSSGGGGGFGCGGGGGGGGGCGGGGSSSF